MVSARSLPSQDLDPGREKDFVIPPMRRVVPEARVHVICGGGTGSHLLRLLHERGYALSAGILSSNDEDTSTARELGAEVVEAPGLRSPPEEALHQVRQALTRADAVVLTPFAVGSGNLTNLRLAAELPPAMPLYVVRGGDFSKRDYTGGLASPIYEALLKRARGAATSASSVVLLLERELPPVPHR